MWSPCLMADVPVGPQVQMEDCDAAAAAASHRRQSLTCSAHNPLQKRREWFIERTKSRGPCVTVHACIVTETEVAEVRPLT